jgi:hypothetical protein
MTFVVRTEAMTLSPKRLSRAEAALAAILARKYPNHVIRVEPVNVHRDERHAGAARDDEASSGTTATEAGH